MDYANAVSNATQKEMEAHEDYPSHIATIDAYLTEKAIAVESYEVAQTGGFVMVPTFYFADGRYLCFTFDGDSWIMAIYGPDHGDTWMEGPELSLPLDLSSEYLRTSIDSLLEKSALQGGNPWE